jgi:hypothetical protein
MLREENKLTVSEKMVLRKVIVVRTADGVTESWRNTDNEELHNLCSSTDVSRTIKCRRMKWTGHVARMIQIRKTKKPNQITGTTAGRSQAAVNTVP